MKEEIVDNLTIEIQKGEMPLVIIEGGKLPRTEKHRDLTESELEILLYPTTGEITSEDIFRYRSKVLSGE